MWDFHFLKALGLMARTAPFILLRMAVYFGIATAIVLITGTGAGIGYGIGGFGDDDFRTSAIFWGGTAGFGLSAGLLFLAREYILYLVKAAHIAVLVDLMDGQEFSGSKSQIAHGTQVVRERFAEASVLFGMDLLIKGVIRAITGLISGVASFLPIPGLDTVMRMLRAFLKVAVGFVDEVILAHAIRTRAENPWRSAEEALVLYGQNYKVMLKNAAWLAAIVYIFAFIVFLLALAPAAALVYVMPGAWSAGGFIFALLFAWAFKAALLEPLAVTCMMQVFFKVTAGQVPDPAWHQKLAQISDKFRTLTERARTGHPQPGGGAGREAAT